MATSMPESVWSVWSRSRLFWRTRALIRRMSSTASSRCPRTESRIGLQALCDMGQTQLAMDTSGAASHSPQPEYPPA